MREKPAAFVIHGGPGSDHSDMKLSFSKLTDRLPVVYFDHRGQGRSARGDVSRYTLDENVEDMEALREHTGIGPIVRIGPSYASTRAMAHGARYPHSATHLNLAVPAAHDGLTDRARRV